MQQPTHRYAYTVVTSNGDSAVEIAVDWESNRGRIGSKRSGIMVVTTALVAAFTFT